MNSMTDFVTLFYCLVFLDPHEFSATYPKFLEAQIYPFINNKAHTERYLLFSPYNKLQSSLLRFL